MRRNGRRARARVTIAVAFVVGLGGTAAFGMIGGAARTTASSSVAQGSEAKELVLPTTPLIGAELVDADDLANIASFALFLPQDPLASSEIISQAWALSDGSKVCIVYSSGLLVYEQAESTGGPAESETGEKCGEECGEESNDPPKDFAAYAQGVAQQDARDFGIDAAEELGVIKGVTSLLIEYIPNENFGVVEFSFGGVRTAIKGEYDVQTLSRVAESME